LLAKQDKYLDALEGKKEGSKTLGALGYFQTNQTSRVSKEQTYIQVIR